MNIIGITAKPAAGAGKDTAASYICAKNRYVVISFADPMKRFLMQLFGWREEVLWGPSELRNIPPNPDIPHLTPRLALQRLGTEFGRYCYPDAWVEYALTMVAEVRKGATYSKVHGITGIGAPAPGVVIPDVRFDNEAQAIRKAGGRVWCLLRGTAGLKGGLAEHISEQGVSMGNIDTVIDNNRTLEELKERIDKELKEGGYGEVFRGDTRASGRGQK